MSVRLLSEVARQAGKAALASATAAAELVGRGEVHVLRELPGRRIEDRALAAGRTGDDLAADPVTDATRAGGRR